MSSVIAKPQNHTICQKINLFLTPSLCWPPCHSSALSHAIDLLRHGWAWSRNMCCFQNSNGTLQYFSRKLCDML